MTKYLQTAVSDFEPQNPNILWLKPVKGGFVLYWNQNGCWEPMQVMNDKGTATTEDDTVIDLSNIPSLETLMQKIKEEVANQLTEHDVSVNDTHHIDSGDDNDYPDITIY